MMNKPYLLFDAGGAIVFPVFDFLSRTAKDQVINYRMLINKNLWI